MLNPIVSGEVEKHKVDSNISRTALRGAFEEEVFVFMVVRIVDFN